MQKRYKILILLLWLGCLKTEKTIAQYSKLNERVANLPNFDNKFIHYGYFIGINQYDFKIDYTREYYTRQNYKDIVVDKKSGFNVGLIGSLRINEFVNLRIEPGLYYSTRDLIYPGYIEFTKESDQLREIKSTYIRFPLLLKISTRRINNVRPYLIGGISAELNLSSNQKNIDDNFNNVFRTTSKNLSYELGFGIDLYLNYFKFSPSIRGIFSMRNELIPDNPTQNGIESPWTGKILKMLSRGFAINFTFE